MVTYYSVTSSDSQSHFMQVCSVFVADLTELAHRSLYCYRLFAK